MGWRVSEPRLRQGILLLNSNGYWGDHPTSAQFGSAPAHLPILTLESINFVGNFVRQGNFKPNWRSNHWENQGSSSSNAPTRPPLRFMKGFPGQNLINMQQKFTEKPQEDPCVTNKSIRFKNSTLIPFMRSEFRRSHDHITNSFGCRLLTNGSRTHKLFLMLTSHKWITDSFVCQFCQIARRCSQHEQMPSTRYPYKRS